MPRMAVFSAPGRSIEMAEVAMPTPQTREILVSVACCTLCRSDLHTHSGRRVEPTPAVLGHEIVGRVLAFGPETPRTDSAGNPIDVGSRVSWSVAVGCGACFFCTHELPQKCERPFKYGHQRLSIDRPHGGGLADFVLLVPGTVIHRVPDELIDAVAALANCATATAVAVLRAGGSAAGRSVLVLGAGVLGLTACAMARAQGASSVLVSDPMPAARERAKRFGATHTFPGDSDLINQVREATAGRGADLVLELAGAADTVRAALTAARVGGRVVLAGTVAPVGTVPLDPEQAVRRMLTIHGVHNYHPDDLGDALAFLAGPGRKYPWADLVAAHYPLSKVERAFADAHAQPGVRVAVTPEASA